MAITSSGLYGKTIEKFFLDTAGFSLEGASIKGLMVTDSYSHDFDVHVVRTDITNEVSGTGYTTGGAAIGTPAVSLASPAAAQLSYSSNAISWASSTIANAMALVGYYTTGSAATDQLVWLSDFVSAASSSGGTFTVTPHANGWWYLDLAPNV